MLSYLKIYNKNTGKVIMMMHYKIHFREDDSESCFLVCILVAACLQVHLMRDFSMSVFTSLNVEGSLVSSILINKPKLRI